jgi:hypothetical protein
MSRSVDCAWHLRSVIWHRGPDFIPCELEAQA